jgi:hypothetical protein
MADPKPLLLGGLPALADAPAFDLDTIKDDLGMPAGDTSQDEWLQRRIDEIWARFEAYTLRSLAVPPATFVDDWSTVVELSRHHLLPPAWDFRPTASTYLRQFPVVAVSAFEIDGAVSDPTRVRFNPKTGQLLAVDLSAWNRDLGPRLYGSRAKITYTAGFATVPPDLYGALIGILQMLWTTRAAQVAGLPAGVRAVSAIDVGEVQFWDAQKLEVARIASASEGGDPVLGAFAAYLSPYVDWRSTLGSPTYAGSTIVPAAPPP